MDIEDGTSHEEAFEDEPSMESHGVMRTRKGQQYERVATNHPPPSPSSWWCCSVVCQTAVVFCAMLLVGMAGFFLGSSRDPQAWMEALNATKGINLTKEESIEQANETMVVEDSIEQEEDSSSFTVTYNPNPVLANPSSQNPFETDMLALLPHIGLSNANNGYFKNPHLVGSKLAFVSEGDAYVTELSSSSTRMPAARVTTTVGNVNTPKWHPTRSLLAYTATYSGRRDVYLMDFEGSPVRLTYWDVGAGVSGVVGWMNETTLLIRAHSNDATAIPDYRLYLLFLQGSQVQTIQPVPLAQAMDATKDQNCWYFVRVKQSSHTIRYVGGTAENLWKYCGSASSQPLVKDDSYKGTSKSPQVFQVDGKKYLFFLSDREHHPQGWIPDRMNVWALPLLDNDSDEESYVTQDLIRITDVGCEFEGRTIQEFSIDSVSGKLLLRIGADLYKVSANRVREKLMATPKFHRFLEDPPLEPEVFTEIEGPEHEVPLSEQIVQEPLVPLEEELLLQDEEELDETMNSTSIATTQSSVEDSSVVLETSALNVTTAATNPPKQQVEQTSTVESLSIETTNSTSVATTQSSVEDSSAVLETSALNVTKAATNPPKQQVEQTSTVESLSIETTNSTSVATTQSSVEDSSVVLETSALNVTTAATNPPKQQVEPTTTVESLSIETIGESEAEDDSENSYASQVPINTTSTQPPKYYYDFESPQTVARQNPQMENSASMSSSEFQRLPIALYSDFTNDQERLIPVNIMKHFQTADVYDSITGGTQMLLTLRGQAWVAPVTKDEVPSYKDAAKNLPARRYRIAPGAGMGGSTRILAALHVPNPVEDETSDRRLAVILATDPLTTTGEHAFYLIETQAGASPLFVSMDQLPKPFLGGIRSGGSTQDGGLGSVKTDTLVMSPCGNRMAWSDTDGRIVVMNLPHYQPLASDEETPEYVVLPKENELGEPMIGDAVDLSFSPGGRYLAITHHAKNRFQIVSIADLGDPLLGEHQIAKIALGRIVQATPSRFNSMDVYWGKTPTDIHDHSQNKTMAKLLGVDEPEDLSTALYFLSDRDIKTDVSSPWGYRQRMPHFVESTEVFVLPLQPKTASEPPKGAFRGEGAEELQVKTLLDRLKLVNAVLDDTPSKTSRRRLAESIHPLAGPFGYAQDAFEQRRRRLEENDAIDQDDHLKEAVFPRDMDIDFGPIDLTFARTAYRLSNIPAGKYTTLLSQTSSGDLILVEDHNLAIFQAETFPSDGYKKKTFEATIRKIAAYGLSSDRNYFLLVYAPDGAIKVVPNTLLGITALQADVTLDDDVVDKTGMHLSVWPALEYRQLYDDAWRMLRDYFYDPQMTGIDWPTIHQRYLPLVERCSKREELDDVLSQMASELSALHVFVYGGEYNSPTHGDKGLEYVNEVGSLGAVLKRTPSWKGYTIQSIPEIDPDFTKIDQSATFYSPLSEESLRLSGQRGLQVGDVIVGVNGESVMSVPDIHMLLRGTSGRSVKLDVLRLVSGNKSETEISTDSSVQTNEAVVESVIAVPISPDANEDLLYRSWEYKTEQLSQELATKAGITVGYVHLQDMSGAKAEDAFARGFFPNYQKQGFILDVRHNRGGNIDAWVLDVLQRKAWMYWKSRDFDSETGGLGWNEHYAFRGHIVVLVNERTSSDGEGVARGISELGLGKIIGTRTWGGGIWLASDNRLVDGGIASAPEIGVYNDRFSWGMGIENMGLDPDIVVDNDPHQAYTGRDHQLERAIEVLKEWIENEPIVIPKPKSGRKDMTMGERECKAKP